MKKPGNTISMVGFWLIIGNILLWLISLITGIPLPAPYIMLAGLICGIIGWVKSKRAGKTNKYAITTVIIASVVYGVAIIVGVINVALLIQSY